MSLSASFRGRPCYAVDRVEIRKDPLGLLALRLPDSPDQQNTTEITVDITASLALLTTAATFYGRQRLRNG